jgi:glycosyltransferase involved in cell wall biosynthesis
MYRHRNFQSNSGAALKISFITWYPSCRRSDALANALGGVSHLIHYLTFKRPLHAPLKYVLQVHDTFRRLRRDRPEMILVASPPVIAVLAVWAYCTLFRARYVIDAHTGVFDDPRWTWLLPLSRFLARRAAATIVTNAFLGQKVMDWGCKAIVIGDVPVDFPRVESARLGVGFHVTVINTFSQDEPLDEILKAAVHLPEVRFHVTGNPKHARNRSAEALPGNVRLTGWLSEDEYAALLLGADAIMCLTTHDYTMQRGAYEAMALEKPLITSNWELLRETFYRGTIHVGNTAGEIADAVSRTMKEREELVTGMRRLRNERLNTFITNLRKLQEALS